MCWLWGSQEEQRGRAQSLTCRNPCHPLRTSVRRQRTAVRAPTVRLTAQGPEDATEVTVQCRKQTACRQTGACGGQYPEGPCETADDVGARARVTTGLTGNSP